MVRHNKPRFPWICARCRNRFYSVEKWNVHCYAGCEPPQKKVTETNDTKPKYDDREVEL